jgi:hypothetical protein
MSGKKPNGGRRLAPPAGPLKMAAETAKARARIKAAKIAGDLEGSLEDLAERLAPYPNQEG